MLKPGDGQSGIQYTLCVYFETKLNLINNVPYSFYFITTLPPFFLMHLYPPPPTSPHDTHMVEISGHLFHRFSYIVNLAVAFSW